MGTLDVHEVLWHDAEHSIWAGELHEGLGELAHDARGAGTVDEDAVVLVDLAGQSASRLEEDFVVARL